jgi:hypothetical protein
MQDSSASAGRASLRHAVRYEAGIWRSLFRWLTRRPRANDPDAELFGYASEITPVLVAFIAVAALEIPILALILPWPTVRYTLLVLGIWGLLWMAGLLASMRVHPHSVAAAGLQLRSGFHLDLRIPWAEITDIHPRRASTERKLEVHYGKAGAVLSLQKTTNLEVTLRHPLTIGVLDGRSAEIDAIRVYADAPSELASAARPHLARHRRIGGTAIHPEGRSESTRPTPSGDT